MISITGDALRALMRETEDQQKLALEMDAKKMEHYMGLVALTIMAQHCSKGQGCGGGGAWGFNKKRT